MTILTVKNLSKSFYSGFLRRKEYKALDNISFNVVQGETLGITGGSGAGKSTLVRCMTGLLRPDKGEIFLEGKDISDLQGRNALEARRKMQLLFQNPELSLDPRMTVRESVEEIFAVHKSLGLQKCDVDVLFDLLQLRKSLSDRYPYQLSGGELQRICLCRLLLLQPSVLILDEPTSMLDASVQAQIVSIIKDIQHSRGITVLFISHDLALLKVCCDRIGILCEGQLVELAGTAEIFNCPRHEYTQRITAAFDYV